MASSISGTTPMMVQDGFAMCVLLQSKQVLCSYVVIIFPFEDFSRI